MKKTAKKLALSTQTLRNLSQLDLARVVGGLAVKTTICPASQVCETRDCLA